MDVLFEDNHLLICHKPAGMLTQDSGTGRANLEDSARQWLKDKYSKPGAVFLEAVHRLDKSVSGIVVFAKTSKALSRLNASFRLGQVEKIYHALVDAAPAEPSAQLEQHWAHSSHHARVQNSPFSGSKPVRLSYQIIAERRLEIQLQTGRYHQIRAQLATLDSPIVGDEKYGSLQRYRGPGIALHHARFTVPHPISKERITITCPAPF